MYNSQIIVCLMLVTLAGFSPIIVSATVQQSSSNSSQGLISELNDSIVNSTISKYPFFVLDCYVSWCEPCKEMNATLHQLSNELNGQIAFGTIEVENNTKVAQRYNITQFPTLLIFNNRSLIDTEIGFGSKSELVNTLEILKPGLNTSRVNLTGKPQMNATIPTTKPTTAPATAPAARQGDIPLINLGIDNPALPMKVNDSTLDFALKKYPFFVLMGFAEWCGYCKEMNTTILELSNELKGQVAFGLIDAEKNINTSTKYDISSYPRILIFKNGSLAQTQRGYTEKSKFVELLRGVDPRLDTSHINITSIPQPAAAPTKPSNQTIVPQKSGTTVVINGPTSGEDPALKYLDRILNDTQKNRTSGTTINIFIINACSQNQGK